MKRVWSYITFSLVAVVPLFSEPATAAATYTEKLKVLAQKYYWGVEAEKDLSKALELYLKAADLGDNEAKYIAGGMYYKGYGTPRDLNKAFSLIYGAALDGKSTTESQKLLGQFFLTGTSTPKNYKEAMKWFGLAAENGDRDAQSELAYLYFTGMGGEKDFDKAFYWYQESARQGLAVAQYSLGIMYFSGTGTVEADPVNAYGWLSLAAAQNHNGAKQARDYIEKNLSPEDLAAAQRRATEFFRAIKR